LLAVCPQETMRIAYLNWEDRRSTIPYYRNLLEALEARSGIMDVDFGVGPISALTRHSAFNADLVVLSKSFAERLFGAPWIARAVRAWSGGVERMVGFLANEHRDVPAKLRFLTQCGCDFIVTQYPAERVATIYARETDARVIGFEGCMSPLPENVRIVPWKEREFDISFRGVKYPYYLGHQDRTLIYSHLSTLKKDASCLLKIDLAGDETNNFMPGDQFLQLLANTRAVLGSEAGGDFLDFDNEIRRGVCALELERKSRGEETTFADVIKTFGDSFELARRTQPSGRLTSSRIFEAASTRTLQILFEGDYCKMFEPWVHYVPLKRDFSNWADVVDVLRDDERATQITEAMYSVCAEKYTYKARVQQLMCDVGLE